ncbi:MAG: spore germination protein [Bacillota bacterium]
MNKLSSFIKKLFIYEKPKNKDGGYELLEDEYEQFDESEVPLSEYEEQGTQGSGGTGSQGSSGQGMQDAKNMAKSTYPAGNAPKAKKPIEVREWNNARNTRNTQPQGQGSDSNLISENLQANIDAIRQIFSMPRNQDIIIRRFVIARKIKAFIVFVDGMADKACIKQFILPQLMNPRNFSDFNGECPIDFIMENVLSIPEITKSADMNLIKTQVLNGSSALFMDNCPEALILETRGYEKRNVDKPVTEQVVRGSQEGFTENLRTNLTLLRRIVKNEKLITEIISIGNLNKVSCAILYIEGITNPRIVREVRRRIKNSDIDFIEGNGMLEQLIEDSPWMIFPQVVTTERPDRASSFLAEGQVVIITEGDPFAIGVPTTFFGLFHSSEDSLIRWQYGTFLRLIRLVGVVSALMIPGMYTALALYHHEMIPTPLLESIIQMRANIPFPTIIELILMEIAFELMREGGVRIPGVIGQTLGILGALVLGQVAVAAGLTSPILIVMVALTGLGSFTMPNVSMAISIRILRFFFIFAGGVAGFYGISLAFILAASLACNMKSFGVPFLSPVAPRTKVNPDVIIRSPIQNQKLRADYLNSPKKKRVAGKVRKWADEGGKNKT